MAFTNEQLRAINTRNKNLLVSAAAGSGKTTVLVERIIGRVLDEDNPVDIDRMLVMTFTKAAAEQMKEKILDAIEKKRADNPTNKHLMKQSMLVHNAMITTIHGFCLNVIRNHFQEIGLNPDFRVADEGECRLLKQDVIMKVIEKAYEDAEEDFITMTECLAAKKNDDAIEEVLNKLYDFAMSYPKPQEWLDGCVDVYEHINDDLFSQQPWAKALLSNTSLVIQDAYNEANRALEIAEAPDGPYMYKDALEKDIELFDDLLGAKTYEEYKEKFDALIFPTLGRAKKDGPYVDPESQKLITDDIRRRYKESINKLKDEEFNLTKQEHISMIKACLPVVKVIVSLTKQVIDEYTLVKRDRNIVDFNDLEHLCIQILTAKDGNTANEYREFFEEIYVDEYQDSNLTQEELLKHIAKENNLFMVGDVKQSIYSFRLARPELFMSKYNGYGSESEVNERIDLHHNFRSRASVLASVNELFEQIMSPQFGGIEYDDAASLHAGNTSYPEVSEKLEKTELMLIEPEDGIVNQELEAKAIAMRIKELKKNQLVYDSVANEMRPCRYSDIVILLRSAKGYDEMFKNVLQSEGIPVFVCSSTGYFSAVEVGIILDYLKILDNPLQDIPLASCLKSVFGGFTDEELALIRKEGKDKTLYEALLNVKEGKEERLKGKVVSFLTRFDAMREKVSYTPVYELLLEIIDGEYGMSVLAMQGGKKRYANLNMLLKKAEDYGETSYKGLFRFVRYIEMLRKYEVDYGEANIIDENDDTVKIMTIHKSKGLEFPVCFIAGMSKRYNFMDAKKNVIPDIDLGLGVNLVDPVRRTKSSTIIRKAISKKLEYDTCAEEQRILYVAMTRAKEKLIMTGILKDAENSMHKGKGVIRCISYMDLILHGLNAAGLNTINTMTVSAATIIDDTIKETVSREASKAEITGIISGKIAIDTSEIKGIFDYEYPYLNEDSIREKVSVSELKKRSVEEDNDKDTPNLTREMLGESIDTSANDRIAELIPRFIREVEEIPANLHGTAVHRILELWDYERGSTHEEIEAFLEYVLKENLMEKSLVDSVKVDEIRGFLVSDTAARMSKAYSGGLLFREQPFVFEADNLLVQGIIDAYFIEDDEIVVVDYKTDKVKKPEELVERYHTQLEYYGGALSKMLNKSVKDLIIFSTHHKKSVKIDNAMVNLS